VINSVTGTKDLQMANISLRVLTRPDEDMLPTIYKQLGTDFDDRVLPSLGNEVLVLFTVVCVHFLHIKIILFVLHSLCYLRAIPEACLPQQCSCIYSSSVRIAPHAFVLQLQLQEAH
jgi:hypothetical protein